MPQCDEDTAAEGNLAGLVRTALAGFLLSHDPCALRHFVGTTKHTAPSASLSWQEGTSPSFHVCFSRFHAIGLWGTSNTFAACNKLRWGRSRYISSLPRHPEDAISLQWNGLSRDGIFPSQKLKGISVDSHLPGGTSEN